MWRNVVAVVDGTTRFPVVKWSFLTPTATAGAIHRPLYLHVLILRGRVLRARLIVDVGWPIVHAAELFEVSWPTAKCLATRDVEMAEAGMGDRSNRPHRSPSRTPRPVLSRDVDLRWRHRLSPLAIASWLSIQAFMVGCVSTGVDPVLSDRIIDRRFVSDRRWWPADTQITGSPMCYVLLTT